MPANVLSPVPSEGDAVWLTAWILTSLLQNYKRISVCFVKPLHLGSFVIAAIGNIPAPMVIMTYHRWVKWVTLKSVNFDLEYLELYLSLIVNFELLLSRRNICEHLKQKLTEVAKQFFLVFVLLIVKLIFPQMSIHILKNVKSTLVKRIQSYYRITLML